MPEPVSFSEAAIRDRWAAIAEIRITSNLDYVRIGEQAVMDVPALLAILAPRPPLGHAAGRCQATTVDLTDHDGRCLWCELPDGHAGKHHAERAQWAPTGVDGFMVAEPVLVDWPDPEDPEVREAKP